MIGLNIQIKLIIFSFTYGFIFSSLLDYIKKIKRKNIVSILFICFSSIVYFIGINDIIDAVFHPYSILCIVFGFVMYDIIIYVIENNKKR